MSEFVTRDVDVHVLPLGKVTLLHPERCVISIGDRTHDIGALCYLRRSNAIRTGGNKSRLVDPSSLERTRIDTARKLTECISLIMRSSGNSMNTIYTLAANVIRFVTWCDTECHKGIFGSEQDTRRAFLAYIEHLRHRVSTDVLHNNTAVLCQNDVVSFLETFIEKDDITHGVRLFRLSQSAKNPTSPPDEASQGKVLSLCQRMFTELAKHVLNHAPYPFKLTLPHYLGWGDNSLWMFPNNKVFLTPHELEQRNNLRLGHWAMNYVEGRLATLDEIASKYKGTVDANRSIRTAEQQITDANLDPQNCHRRTLAMLAHNSFVMLFIANTGMNWSEVRRLPWGKDYEVGDEHQGFREIKFRAKGRNVSFEIQTSFLAKFKRYLELRAYLVNGKSYGTLFLSLGMRAAQKPRPMGDDVLSALINTLRRIDPSLPRILARQWRASKSDYLITRTDPSTTALILQNNESTVLQSYVAGSESRAIAEMGQFYEKLTRVVLDAGQTSPANITDSAIGECTQYGSPVPTDAAPPIAPDCHQSEGCLFCDKYVVHADERDVRKLMSCRTCIYRMAHLSASEEYFQSLFGEVLHRIDAILGTIGGKSEEHKTLVERVRVEVEDGGQLDPYWEHKMQTLSSLGVVSQ